MMSRLNKLVERLGVERSFPEERRSTTWKGTGVPALALDDIATRWYSCCRVWSFGHHLSVVCGGLGPVNVAAKTWFRQETHIPPALLHALKSRIRLEIRACSIRHEDILRLRAFDDNLGSVAIVCRTQSYVTDPSVSSHAGTNSWFATEKIT